MNSAAVTPPPPEHAGPVAGVSKGNVFWGWVLLADQIRPEAGEAVRDGGRFGLQGCDASLMPAQGVERRGRDCD